MVGLFPESKLLASQGKLDIVMHCGIIIFMFTIAHACVLQLNFSKIAYVTFSLMVIQHCSRRKNKCLKRIRIIW